MEAQSCFGEKKPYTFDLVILGSLNIHINTYTIMFLVLRRNILMCSKLQLILMKQIDFKRYVKQQDNTHYTIRTFLKTLCSPFVLYPF